MTSQLETLDDLIARSRRGPLSDGDQRRLHEALAASPEARLLYEAGHAFEREAPVEAGDEQRIARAVRDVEKALTPKPRSALRIALPAALVGALLASTVIAAVQLYFAPEPKSPAQQLIVPPRSPAAPSVSASLGAPPAIAVPMTSATSAAAVPSANGAAPVTRAPHVVTPIETAAPAVPDIGEPAAPDAAALFSAANHARVGGDVASAISLYRRLQSEFPQSAEASSSRVSLGMLLLQHGDAAAAVDVFRAYRARGGGAREPEAWWGEAQALRQLGRGSEERAALTELVKRYPGSAYFAAAQKRLAESP